MKYNKLLRKARKRTKVTLKGLRKAGITLAALPIGITAVEAAPSTATDLYDYIGNEQGSGTFSGDAGVSGFDLLAGHTITVNPPATNPPGVLASHPHIRVNDNVTINLNNFNETFSSLLSESSGQTATAINFDLLNIALTPVTSTVDPSVTVGSNDTYAGTLTGNRLIVTSTDSSATGSFAGAENITLLGTVDLQDAPLDNQFGTGPFTATNINGVICQIGESSLTVGDGVNAVQLTTAANIIDDNAAVQVESSAEWELQGDETIMDLWIKAGGVVDADGALTITDHFINQGTLEVAGPLCLTTFKGNGNFITQGDLLWAPTAATSYGGALNIAAHDFIKTGAGALTLTASQNYTGATWVQSGVLNLNGTSDSSALVVTGDVASAEAVGATPNVGGLTTNPTTGGEIYLDDQTPGVAQNGNIAYADLLNKAGSVTPVLNISTTSQATDITVGSVNNTATDFATVTTVSGNSEQLANGVSIDIYDGGELLLNGNQLGNDIGDITFLATTGGQTLDGFVNLGQDSTFGLLTDYDVNKLDTGLALDANDLVTGTNTDGLINLADINLNLAQDNSSSVYGGSFGGLGTINKFGTGEVVLANSSVGITHDTNRDSFIGVGETYSFGGDIDVVAGVLDVRHNTALGLSGIAGGPGALSTVTDTTVSAGAELQLNNAVDGTALTVAENFNIAGCGVGGTTGAIHNQTGNSTLTGQISLTGDAALFAATGTTLTHSNTGLITSLAATDPVLFLDGPGNFDLDALIDVNISSLYKTGIGMADISGTDHQYQTAAAADGVADTLIQNGTLRIDHLNNLGGPNADVIAFVADTDIAGELATLDYRPATIGAATLTQQVVVNSALANAKYVNAGATPGLDVAVINVDDGNGIVGDSSLTIDIVGNPIVFADPSSGIYKTGQDDLILDATTATVLPTAINTVDFGGVLNPADDETIVNGAGVTGNGASCSGPLLGSHNFQVAGLGSIDAVATTAGTNNDGTLTINGFDNFIVSQVTDTTFGGNLNTSANFLYNSTNGSTLTLSGGALGSTFTGNIFVSGGRLVAGTNTALGSFGAGYDNEATYICGTMAADPTQAFSATNCVDYGTLALIGGVTASENITIFNDGLLVSESGANTVIGDVRIKYDAPNDVFGGNDAYAVIGAETGSLSLANGVFSDQAANPGVRLNGGTLAKDGSITTAHNGTLTIANAIRNSVGDVEIGHVGSTGTVVLQSDNDYTGNTSLFGGTVDLQDANGFSDSTVTVESGASLQGGVSIVNDILLNDKLTTTEDTGTLALNGTISGSSGITNTGAGTLDLGGTNLFTGALKASAGTVNVLTDSAASEITSSVLGTQVNIHGVSAATALTAGVGSTITTQGADLLADTAVVTADGLVDLGGPETVGTITGIGTLKAGGDTVTDFLSGSVKVDNGGYDLTVSQGAHSGVISGTGDLIKDGNQLLTLSGANTYTGETLVDDGTLTITGSIASPLITVADNAKLNLDGANLATGSELVNDGTTVVTGSSTIGELYGGSTGLLEIDGILSVEAGSYDGIISGAGSLDKVTIGSLTLNGDSDFTGATTVSAGSLILNGTLDSTNVTVNGTGTSLVLGSDERLLDTAILTVTGGASVVTNGTETVGTANLGSQNVVGSGEIIATNFNLDGTTIDAVLQGGVINTVGATTINSTTSADALNVTGGVLDLNETIDTDTIDVFTGATLNSNGSELLNDTAVVTADGLWAAGGNETISSLMGAGSVNTDIYDLTLLNGANFSGVLDGSGNLTIAGDATLSGVNTHSGNLDVTDGTTDLTTTGSIASGTVNVFAGARLDVYGESLSNSSEVIVDGVLDVTNRETIGNLDASGAITGSGTLIATTYDLTGAIVDANLGSGVLSSYGETFLNGSSAAEDVMVESGNLILLGVDSILDTADVSLVGGLELNDNETIGNLSGGGDTNVGGHTFTVSSGSYSGDIYGAGNLEVDGGVLDLNNGSTYTGSTTVTTGSTLNVDADLSSNDLFVDGALTTTAAEILSDDADVSGLGNVSFGADETVHSITGGISVNSSDDLNVSTLNTSGSVTAEDLTVDTLYGSNAITLTGDLTVDGGSYAGALVADDLTVIGQDLFTLAGSNTLSGVTNVLGGELDLDTTLSSAIVSVASGAVIDAVDGSLVSGVDLTVDGNASLANENLGLLRGTGALSADSLIVDEGHFDGIINVASRFTVNEEFISDSSITTSDLTVSGSMVSNDDLSVANEIILDNGVLSLNDEYSFTTLSGQGAVNAESLNVASGSTIAPSSTIDVNGDYSQSGLYETDVTSLNISDTVTSTGVATIDRDSAVLSVSDINASLDPLGSSTNVINAAGGIVGGFSALNSNSSANLLFDIGTGDVTSLGVNAFDNCTVNESAIISSITGDAIDGVNFDSLNGAGELLSQLILTPGAEGVKNAINQISPEAYAGAVDYTMQSIASYSNAVRTSAPLTVVKDVTISGGGPKGGLSTIIPDTMTLEVLAGGNYFNTGTDSSQSGNDYDLDGSGGYTGVRLNGNDGTFSAGVYAGFDEGNIDSNNIQVDASGIIFGAFTDFKPDADGKLTLSADASYGSFSYDANHIGNRAQFDGTGFELSLGAEYLAYQNGGLSILPSVGVSYLTSSTDAFEETGGNTALSVAAMNADATLAEVGVTFSFSEINSPFGVSGYLGYQHNLADTERDVTASFGGTPFTVQSAGFGESAFIYSVGAHVDLTDTFRVHASYTGASREDSKSSSSANIGASFAF